MNLKTAMDFALKMAFLASGALGASYLFVSLFYDVCSTLFPRRED